MTASPGSPRMANSDFRESPRIVGAGRAAGSSAGGAVLAGALWHKSAESGRDPLPDWWTDTDSAVLGRPPLAQSVSFLPVVYRTSDNPVTGYPQISRNRKCDRGVIRIGKGSACTQKIPGGGEA